MLIQKIILGKFPSQIFDIILNDYDCNISIYLKNDKYYFDLISNDKKIVAGVKINYGCLLLNYPYLRTIFNGNFVILNENNDTIINYENFGNITNLYFLTEN